MKKDIELNASIQHKGYGKNKWLEKKLEDAEDEIDDLYNLIDTIYRFSIDKGLPDKEFREYVYHVILEEIGF